MAAPKLTTEQRETLLIWLAAEYSGPLIAKWFADKKWPSLDPSALTYYRNKYQDEIEAARKERRASAINSGLALKEERVQRLADHADELEAIKWLADDKGRLWNEKAWRETLADIASEMGHRKTTSTNLNYDMTAFTDDELARIAEGVDPAQVIKERKLQ